VGRDIGKEQVRFVEEENQLRFLRVAYLREILKQLGKHPQQKRRVNLGRFLHQLVRCENIDHSSAALRLDQVVEIKCRLAEEFVGALRFKREEAALNRSGAGGRDISKLRFELIGIVRNVLQHCT
jgi:uncharacterized protein (DUF2336 family)